MKAWFPLLLALLIAKPAMAETAYVSNELDDTIAVVSGADGRLVATIPVGRRPRGLALSADARLLYVALGDDNGIAVVDTATRRVVGTLPSGPDPEFFVLHPDGRRLFVANENDNLVSVLDLATGTITAEVPVGVEPEGMAVSADGRWVLNTTETTSMVHFIDAESLEVEDSVLVDTRPRMAAFAPGNEFVWVTSEIRGTVTVIDAATREITGRIGFRPPGVPRELVQAVGIAFTRDGSRAFVALGPANRVAELDPRSLEIRRYFLVGQRVWHITLSPDERRLWTANGNSGDVTVIDLERNEPLWSIAVGRSPWGVVVAP